MKQTLEINKREIIILPEQEYAEIPFTKKIGVFIHLYYEDSVGYYANCIKNIPAGIDLYISYSNEQIKEYIQSELKKRGIEDCQFISKENRGRDVSALLVAFREIMTGYDYVCFLHDKKAKSELEEEMTEEWIYSPWENMLSCENYIKNVISIFEEREDVGLLLPPYMASRKSTTMLVNEWAGDYQNAYKLVEKLGLNSMSLR